MHETERLHMDEREEWRAREIFFIFVCFVRGTLARGSINPCTNTKHQRINNDPVETSDEQLKRVPMETL